MFPVKKIIMENILINRAKYFLLILLALSLLCHRRTFGSEQTDAFVPVDQNSIPQILTMIGIRIKENYNKIHIWQGTKNIVRNSFYENAAEKKAFRAWKKIEGPLPEKIATYSEQICEFTLDADKDMRFENRRPIGTMKLIDLKTGREFEAKTPADTIMVAGSIRAIVRPDAHFEWNPVSRNKDDGTITRCRVVKQARPQGEITCGSGLYPVYDPRETFTVFASHLWDLFPRIISIINEKGSFGTGGQNLKVEEFKSGNVTKYRIIMPTKSHADSHDINFFNLVFSSEKGFNIISFSETSDNNKTFKKTTWEYDLVGGIYIPSQKIEMRFDEITSTLKEETILTFSNQKVNEALSEDVFTYKNLGLKDGDIFIDKIDNKEYRYKATNKTLEPIEKK